VSGAVSGAAGAVGAAVGSVSGSDPTISAPASATLTQGATASSAADASSAGPWDGSYSGYSGDGWFARYAKPGPDRIRLLAAGSEGSADVTSSDRSANCEGVLCTLTVGIGGAGALVRSLVNIIKSLAVTGLSGLTLLAMASVLTVAGGLALAEARRRDATARFLEAPVK